MYLRSNRSFLIYVSHKNDEKEATLVQTRAQKNIHTMYRIIHSYQVFTLVMNFSSLTKILVDDVTIEILIKTNNGENLIQG